MSRAHLLAVVCLAVAAPAAATLYKWTDANGRVVYSDIAPSGNVKVETVQGAPPPSNRNAVKDMAAREADAKKQKSAAAEKEKKDEEQRADLNKRAEECQRAQNNLRQLAAEQIVLMRMNEKGDVVAMDEVTRRRERTDVEQFMRQNCNGLTR
jgi:hypothetical protein